MSTQHTPGPWAVNTAGTGDSKGRIVIDEIYVYAPKSGADDVAVAADIADPLTGQPSESNARLIAAAPELLEFAEEVRRTGDTRLASMAIAVIAKATGAA